MAFECIVIILCLALFPWKDADNLARKQSQFGQYEDSLKNKIIRNVSAVFTVIVSGFLLSFFFFYCLPGLNKELHSLGSFWYFIDHYKKYCVLN